MARNRTSLADGGRKEVPMDDSATVGRDCVVSIHYTLTDESGKVLDSSEGAQPLTYLHGHGQIIEGLEKKLTNASVGDAFELTVPAEEGYGEHDPKRIVDVPRDRLDFDVKAGDVVNAKQPDGRTVPFQVMAVEEGKVTLDGNHPLAGKTLNFSVRVVRVRPASAEELEHGHAHA